MDSLHNTLVFVAKTGGLFYLILLSVVIVAYALWPSNRQSFDAAAKSILESEDKPCP
ncbi:cytochrome C oxidase Cbb3 [Chromatiales bacterium (ex Bugula neritina AB1)]|nr:cytochrome C oxidase Cbb3 [Chromatiales bacterium (ex Bugula neritina AB1)]